MQKDMLCFDFISDTIKAARLEQSVAKKAVSELFYKEVKGFSKTEIVKALGDFLAQSKNKSRGAMVSIPSGFLITKNIEIPSCDPKEIREIINLQAGRLTPYSKEEVIIDYVNIGVFRQSYTKLLLILVNKEVVTKQLAYFSEAGLRVQRVVLPSQAQGSLVYEHLKHEIQNSVFCLVHTDALLTDFSVFLRDKQIFLRSIPIGARHLLGEKERYLGRFIEELKKSLDAYQAEDIEAGPMCVVFSGCVQELRDLEIMMLDALRMPTRLLTTADLVPVSGHLSKESLSPQGVSLLNCISPLFGPSGAAINLVPEEVKLKNSLEERGRDIIKTGVLIMTVLLFVCGIFLVDIYLKSEYLKKLNARFKTLNSEAGQIEKDFSRIRIIRDCLLGRGRSLNVLAQLYELTALEVALNNIRLKENGALSIRGEASAMSAVFSYLRDLESSSYFKEVKTKYTSKKKVEDKEIVEFEIAAALEGLPEETS